MSVSADDMTPAQAQAAMEDAFASLAYVWGVQRRGAPREGKVHFESDAPLVAHALMTLAMFALDQISSLGGETRMPGSAAWVSRYAEQEKRCERDDRDASHP